MKIVIPYESKWSASLMDHETGLTKFKSVGDEGLAKKTVKKKQTYIYSNDSYEHMMKRVNENHVNFDYKTISNNTVIGILARLLGEIRYMKDALKDKDHIIHSLQNKVSFNLKNRDLYNEVVSLNTPLKPSRNNGQGLITKNKDNILLYKNDYSEIIYSILNIQNLEQLEDIAFLFKRDSTLDDMKNYLEQQNLLERNIEIYKLIENFEKCGKAFKKIEKSYVDYLTNKNFINEEITKYISILNDLGSANYNNEMVLARKKGRAIPGVLIYSAAYWLIRNGHKNEIENFLFNKNRNIPGLATLNGKAKIIGALTIKDLYKYFSEGKKTFSSPYVFSMEFFKKEGENNPINTKTKLGLGKEDGILEINIDIPREEAIQLKKQIEDVAVSTFQMGKKGLAYVRRIEI